MKYKPRNDNVLVSIRLAGQTEGGLYMPQISAEAKQYFVEAVGPKVEHLNVGDRVFMLGELKKDYDYIPGTKDLILINEKNVVLIIVEDEE